MCLQINESQVIIDALVVWPCNQLGAQLVHAVVDSCLQSADYAESSSAAGYRFTLPVKGALVGDILEFITKACWLPLDS